ncbi:Uncharacterized protein Adt_02558 [Abeliophyllum distichum]|uniref:Uncharacterized protein n=1 Tax=Abeliophyllum distichum TaxID=126358 RepID=A0ABD1VZA4_9LAMI
MLNLNHGERDIGSACELFLCSRSRSPPKRERSIEHEERRSMSASPPPSKRKKRSPARVRNPIERVSPSLSDGREANELEYGSSPNERIGSPKDDVEQDHGAEERSPIEENGRSLIISPRDNGSSFDDGSPRDSD